MKNKKYVFIGLLVSVVVFLSLGTVTALIPTGFFKRMVQITILDYVFLTLTSIMSGAFISLHFYGKQKTTTKNDYTAAGGAASSIFGFSCPICNALLVSLFGTGVVLSYFEPLRPIFGFVGIIVLGIALYIQIKNIKVSLP